MASAMAAARSATAVATSSGFGLCRHGDHLLPDHSHEPARDRRIGSSRCFCSAVHAETPWMPLIKLRCSDPHPGTCTTNSMHGKEK